MTAGHSGGFSAMAGTMCVESAAHSRMEHGFHVTTFTDATAAFGGRLAYDAMALRYPRISHATLSVEELLSAVPSAGGQYARHQRVEQVPPGRHTRTGWKEPMQRRDERGRSPVPYRTQTTASRRPKGGPPRSSLPSGIRVHAIPTRRTKRLPPRRSYGFNCWRIHVSAPSDVKGRDRT